MDRECTMEGVGGGDKVKLEGKNVLVTGGAGFVGGHLVEKLIRMKANVVIVDIEFNNKSYLFTEKFDRKSKAVKLNVCEYAKLQELIKKYEINFIFHLAAQALVEEAYINPKQTLENNILSTINVLEIARLNSNIKGVIVASSDKAYGDLTKKKYFESDPLSGDHPYEVSKSSTDLISGSYFKTYGTPVVVSRFGNIYGEGDLNFSRIIPGIMNSLTNETQLEIRSDGKYIRDYLYVKDVVDGYLLLAEHIETIKGEVFNFGSNDTLTVLEVIKLAEDTLNRKIKNRILNTVKNEIPYQSLDYTKVNKAFGWKPKVKMQEMFPIIYRWYKKILS